MKRLIKVAAITAAVCIGLSACSTSSKSSDADNTNSSADSQTVADEEATEVTEGKAAPDISFVLSDGSEAKLSDYRGKPVLINFWATWCKPCVEEMTAFEKLKENYGDDITILALNCGGDTQDVVNSFMEEGGYTFTVALVYGEEARKYDVQAIPYTVIVDAEGTVVYTNTGADNADTMYNDHYEPAVKSVLGLD